MFYGMFRQENIWFLGIFMFFMGLSLIRFFLILFLKIVKKIDFCGNLNETLDMMKNYLRIIF